MSRSWLIDLRIDFKHKSSTFCNGIAASTAATYYTTICLIQSKKNIWLVNAFNVWEKNNTHTRTELRASPDEGYSNLLILSVTRWRLFQSVDIERHQMKVIPICWYWASPDEGYSNLLILSVTRWWLFQSVDIERHQMKVIPICWYWASPDEGYSNLLILGVTRWRLF
jgi:hypothetical protein